MKNKIDIIFLILVCVIFFVIANIYNIKTDIFNAPDEFGHFEYIRFLNINHHFPTLTTKTSFWEAHQPPLYYLALSPIDLVLKNRISIDLEVKLLRLFSSLLGVLTVVFAFLTAKLLFSGKKIVYYSLTLAFCLWPMFLFISGVLNNDVLANLLGMIMIYCLVKLRISTNALRATNITNTDLLICGVIAGMAFLTKLTLYPVAIFFLAIIFWKSRHNFKDFLKFTLLPAFVVCFAWMLRNLIFVGDFFGLKYTDKFWEGQHRDLLNIESFITWLKELGRNFLGVFGYANIGFDPKYYRYFLYFVSAIIVLLPLILIFYWIKDKKLFKNLIILGCFFAITFLTTFYYSLENYQPQGRYLLPALFVFVFYIVALLIIIIPKKLRVILLVIIILVLGYLNVDAFKHINWVNAHAKKMLEEEKNNLFLDEWKAKNGKWKKENDYYVYKKNGEDSFLRSYPNLRLNTNVVQKLILKIKTNNFDKLKFCWSYVGDESRIGRIKRGLNGIDKQCLTKEIKADGNWNIYEIDFENLRKNDLVQIMRFESLGKDEGRIEFDTIRVE